MGPVAGMVCEVVPTAGRMLDSGFVNSTVILKYFIFNGGRGLLPSDRLLRKIILLTPDWSTFPADFCAHLDFYVGKKKKKIRFIWKSLFCNADLSTNAM